MGVEIRNIDYLNVTAISSGLGPIVMDDNIDEVKKAVAAGLPDFDPENMGIITQVSPEDADRILTAVGEKI